jgi:hypothetical protein
MTRVVDTDNDLPFAIFFDVAKAYEYMGDRLYGLKEIEIELNLDP